jgi:hypothetical protein
MSLRFLKRLNEPLHKQSTVRKIFAVGFLVVAVSYSVEWAYYAITREHVADYTHAHYYVEVVAAFLMLYAWINWEAE